MSKVRTADWRLAIAAVAASAAAFFFSTGGGTTWALAWLAPAPILAVAPALTRRAAAAAAFGAWGLGALSWWMLYAGIFPAAAILPITFVPSAVFALGVLWHRRALRACHPAVAVFAFPALWTAYEFLLFQVSPHGTAGSYGYTQAGALTILQIVSLGGLPALSFLLMLVPTTAAVMWTRRRNFWTAILVAVVPAALLVAALAYGSNRLAQTDEGRQVRIGLVADDRLDMSDAMGAATVYSLRAEKLAARGAELVVLPEKFAVTSGASAVEVRRLLSETARRAGVVIVAGLDESPPRRNLAVTFGSDGSTRLEYAKRHLVPGFEDAFQPGHVAGPLALPGVSAGVAICKDLDFVAVGREAGLGGTRLMLVPAWDFVRDAHLHSRMAIVRGVEGGFAVARAARNGLLTLSDAFGRVRAEQRTSATSAADVVAAVPPGPGGTPYSRFGDWFAWLNIAACIWFAVIVARRR